MRLEIDDKRMELTMGMLLRFGVVMASTLVLAGVFFFLLDHARQPVNYRNFVPHPLSIEHRQQLLSGISRGNAAAIIQVGILFLIATPVARVVFAVMAFLLERDWLYTAISLAVLGVLLFSLTHPS